MSGYNPPSELQQLAPRATRPTSKFTNSVLLQVLIIVVMLLACSGAGYLLKQKLYLKNHGSPIEGTLVNLQIEVTGGRHSTENHYAEYTYSPLGKGLTYDRKKVPLDKDVYQTLKTGQELPLVYDPQNPSHSMALCEQVFDPLFLWFPALVVLFGWLLFSNVRGYIREKRLLQSGTVTAGTLKDEKRFVYRGRVTLTFTYEFHDSAGVVQTNIRRRVPAIGRDVGTNETDQPYEPFDVIKENTTVLYDPYDSRLNLLYPSARVQLA